MEASHKTHRPHIKVGKDEEEEDVEISYSNRNGAHDRVQREETWRCARLKNITDIVTKQVKLEHLEQCYL